MVRKAKSKEEKHYHNFNKQKLKVLPIFEIKNYTCPKGHCFQLDFNKKHVPMKTIKLNDGSVAIPTDMNIRCPICNESFSIKLPVKKEKRKFYLFGDEAYRGDDGKSERFICNYSLVGINTKKLIEAENRILEFKSKYFPNNDPWEWKIHIKEMASSNHRKKHDLFKNMQGQDVMNFIEDLYSLIKKMTEKDELMIISSTVLKKFPINFKKRKEKEKELKKLTYELAFFHTTDLLTQHEVNPCFIFDSEKKSNELKVIQQWADNIFYSGQYSKACAFYFKGIDVSKPIFVKPASRPLLEIADLICYTMARFLDLHFNKNIKHDDLYHPLKLGKIIYILGVEHQNGFLYGHSPNLEEFLSKANFK